ncbi:MAG: UDP-2,3-diacylglucosamine diphosphatase LpxI, partial [Syntrophaceae bacterium]|nr:UDP-2,3-diacylglucosamine diphosphatase LpxI [Syntrophaceae bacterium]
ARFDHPPVIGLNTLAVSLKAGISAIAFEAEKTIVLEKQTLIKKCNAKGIALIGL